MRSKERTQRLHRDLPFVANHPSAKWTTDILKDLAQLKVTTERAKSKLSLVPAAVPLDTDALLKIYDEAADVGLSTIGKRVIILDYGGTLLFKERFDVYIKQTLSAISGRRPTDKVMDSLQKLCDDPRNVVMVMTGLTKMKLGSVFQGMKNLTLVTSNGMVYSWGENLRMQDEVVYDTERLEGQPGSAAVGVDAASSSAAGGSVHERMLAGGNGEADGSASTIAPTSASRSPGAPFLGEGSGSIAGATDAAGSLHVTPANRELYASVLSDEERRWNCLDFGIDWTAVRDIAVPIITKFTFRTNGTCQSPRIPGIGWSYFGADPEWAEPQAAQLQVELEAALANHDVMVVTQIQGSVEVVPKKLNKGVLVTTLLERVLAKRAGRLPAMCLIMGDDRADDNMFEAGYNVYSQMNSSSGLHSSKLMTVCVGEKETNANLYAQDVKHVENILQALASSHTTSTKEALPQALSATPSFAMISSRSNSDAFFDGFSTQASTRDNSPKGAR
jgi:trehalose-phosphatase